MPIQWKTVYLRMDPDMHKALKVRCANEGTSMALIGSALVKAYLEDKVTVKVEVGQNAD